MNRSFFRTVFFIKKSITKNGLLTAFLWLFGLTLSAQCTATVESTPYCQNVCNGTLTVVVSGAVEPISYTWNVPEYNNMNTINGVCFGNYQVTVVDATGCSAVAISDAELYPVSATEISISVCPEDYIPPYENPAVFTDVNGCDSFVYINLEILETEPGHVNLYTFPGDSVLYNGEYYTAGSYELLIYGGSQYGCDSLVLITVEEIVATTHLKNDPGLAVFPNPANDQIAVELQGLDPESIAIYNYSGQRVFFEKATTGLQYFQVGHLPEGIYFAKVNYAAGIAKSRFTVLR